MRNYEQTTDALRAILLMYQRGYRYGVTFESDISKLDALAVKFDENFGVNLPAWKRYQRRRSGLPNAWSCSFPLAGRRSKCQVVLLTDSTPDEMKHLDAKSPWLREKWRPADTLEIGDYCVARDRRERGDYADTIKLTPRVLHGLESYWRMLSKQNIEQLAFEADRAVSSYSLFGGVRRQLRRLIRGYAKLYEKKLEKKWPGPDPDKLPSVGGFKKEAA